MARHPVIFFLSLLLNFPALIWGRTSLIGRLFCRIFYQMHKEVLDGIKIPSSTFRRLIFPRLLVQAEYAGLHFLLQQLCRFPTQHRQEGQNQRSSHFIKRQRNCAEYRV